MGIVPSIIRQACTVDARAERKARHDYENYYLSLRARLKETHGPHLGRLRVLDFGCGYTYPMLVLLQQDVREVVGLEVAPVFRDGWKNLVDYYGGVRKPGGAAEALLQYCQATRYYGHLQRQSQAPARHADYQIVRYQGGRIPFEDGAFDCLISNAVLQELPGDLGEFAAEMARVVAPGGAIDLEWHNFYSFNGHYLDEAESRRNPWGHLLQGRYHPSLNRITPAQVEAAFSPWFSEVRLIGHDIRYRLKGKDADYQPEGEEYLTPELEARLQDYPRDWLLTRGFILQARRA